MTVDHQLYWLLLKLLVTHILTPDIFNHFPPNPYFYYYCVDNNLQSSCHFVLSNSLKSANFPTHLLPVVAESSAVAGKLQQPLFGIPSGISVGVALGDFQCAVLSTISSETDAGMLSTLAPDKILVRHLYHSTEFDPICTSIFCFFVFSYDT